MNARRLFLAMMLVGSACTHTDNVGEQCQPTSVQCTTDQGCANYPQGVCGADGLCAVCGTVDEPDTNSPTCMTPPPGLQCVPGTADCSNYPGSVCGPDGTCACPVATCSPPPPGLQCVPGTADCSNYPGSVCGPNGTCECSSSCVAPPPGLQCVGTDGTNACANYPGSVCGENGSCVCP